MRYWLSLVSPDFQHYQHQPERKRSEEYVRFPGRVTLWPVNYYKAEPPALPSYLSLLCGSLALLVIRIWLRRGVRNWIRSWIRTVIPENLGKYAIFIHPIGLLSFIIEIIKK